MFPAISVLIFLILLYLLALRGRSSHPGLKAFRDWKYAHRGLHDDRLPENSLGAFEAARDNGYGIELDLHLLKDGNIAILHDSDLKRVTGREGILEDLSTEELKNYHLNGTEYTIPTFRQVLDLYQGKAPLIVELKTHNNNHAALCETACRMLDDYQGTYCLESFDPRCVYWLKKNRPDLIRGQLSENFIRSMKGKQPWILCFIATYQLQTFVTKPDFIACRFSERNIISNRIARKLWHLQGVTWTIRSQEELETAQQEGWIPIFETIRP